MSQPPTTTLSNDQQRQLVADLVASVQKIAPAWTNTTSSDPGITLLELLAWLSDTVLYRVGSVSDRKADLLNQMIARLAAVRAGMCTASDLTRPRYFFGQLLTASDFQDEQNYTRNVVKRQNRCLIGTGIVNGLGVAVDSNASTNDAPVITVAPGSAIAPDGQQLTICEPLRCALHASAFVGYVVLQYTERPIDPVPVLDGPPEFSRIEEGIAVSFEEVPLAQGVAIARLKRKSGRWTLDSRFRPPRIRRR